MNISNYMIKHDMKDGDFAPLVGCDRATISRIRRGVAKPSSDLITKIYEVTDGKVTANDFFHEVIQ